jgi:dolichol kinase
MTVLPAGAWFLADWLGLALSAAFLVASIALEIIRRHWSGLNAFLRKMLPGVIRDTENQGVLGSTWFAIGAFVAFLVFGPFTGGAAVLFLAWGDPAAAIAGRKWGNLSRRKTWVGSLACLGATSLAALAAAHYGNLNLWAALCGAGAATLVERCSPQPDDNVWIPILSGLSIWIVQKTLVQMIG